MRTAQAPTTTRAFAFITGSLGLLAVGALMLTLTPRGGEPPVAIGATTLPLPPIPTVVRLATPIGDGRLALTIGDADSGTQFDVQLASGPVVTAVVDTAQSGVVLLAIKRQGGGHPIASTQPDDDEIVTVLADPPVTIAFADIGTVDADEGTPVLDEDGELVGLCTRKGAAMSVVDVTGTMTAGDVPATTTVSASQPAAATTGAP